MRISTKLTLFFAAVMAVFCALAVSSFLQLRHVPRDYDALLNTSVRDMDRARLIQLEFKKQVQEWKDILLRGHNPQDLSKYTLQFHNESDTVASEAAALAREAVDPEARDLLQQFLRAHRAMNEKYEQAYAIYVNGHADFKAADKIVRGQDRAPTILFDQVVQRLDARLRAAIEIQEASARKQLTVAIAMAGGLLGIICALGLLTVRSVLKRIESLRAISDRIAHADIEGLAIPISGTDEIGQFGDSMRGIYSAIEELLKLAGAAMVSESAQGLANR